MSVSPADVQALHGRIARAQRPPENVRFSQERLWEQMQALVREDGWASLRAALEGLRDDERAAYDEMVLKLSVGSGPSKHLVSAIRGQWRVVHTLNMVLDRPGALAAKAKAVTESLDKVPSPSL